MPCREVEWEDELACGTNRKRESDGTPSRDMCDGDWITVFFAVGQEFQKMRGINMVIQGGLALEFFVEHELGRVLLVEMKLVGNASRLVARGSEKSAELIFQVLLTARNSLHVHV